MDSTLWWTVGVFAVVGLIAIIFGVAVLLSLWWVIVPLAGAVWGGWPGLLYGIGFVVLLSVLLGLMKKK